jgi:hypothetical protein
VILARVAVALMVIGRSLVSRRASAPAAVGCTRTGTVVAPTPVRSVAGIAPSRAWPETEAPRSIAKVNQEARPAT